MSEFNKISKKILNKVQDHIEKNKHRRFRNKHKVKIFSSTAEVFVIEELKDCFASIYEHAKIWDFKDVFESYKNSVFNRFSYNHSNYTVTLFEMYENECKELEEIFHESFKDFTDNYDIAELYKLKRRRVKKYEAENRFYDSEYKKYETAFVNFNIEALNRTDLSYVLNKKLKKVKNCNF